MRLVRQWRVLQAGLNQFGQTGHAIVDLRRRHGDKRQPQRAGLGLAGIERPARHERNIVRHGLFE